MPPKPRVKTVKIAQKAPLKERAVEAALRLSQTFGWDMVSMNDIAQEVGAPLSDLSEIFDDKGDILSAYGRIIDKKVLERFPQVQESMTERDRLFDILMERFDVLNEDRVALHSILKSFLTDPRQAVLSLPHLGRSMAWMLEGAGIDTNGMKGAIKIAGLTAVYLYTLNIWVKDESVDLSKTMAALDKALSRAEQAANTIG